MEIRGCIIGWYSRERGGLQIGRAIPKVYQGYTIDISTSIDGGNTKNISHPTGILRMVIEW